MGANSRLLSAQNWIFRGIYASALLVFVFVFATAGFGQGPWESEQRVSELPDQVKTFLRTANDFTIRMEAVEQDGKWIASMDREYKPNRSLALNEITGRDNFIDKFIVASTYEGMGSICYLPSHSIEAKKGEQFVNIEICFGCRKFVVEGSFGEFYGTIGEDQESEAAFNKFLLDN